MYMYMYLPGIISHFNFSAFISVFVSTSYTLISLLLFSLHCTLQYLAFYYSTAYCYVCVCACVCVCVCMCVCVCVCVCVSTSIGAVASTSIAACATYEITRAQLSKTVVGCLLVFYRLLFILKYA